MRWHEVVQGGTRGHKVGIRLARGLHEVGMRLA